jgi:hypothetical protein
MRPSQAARIRDPRAALVPLGDRRIRRSRAGRAFAPPTDSTRQGTSCSNGSQRVLRTVTRPKPRTKRGRPLALF